MSYPNKYADEILMESGVHTMTLVLLLYFSQEEAIPNCLIILHKQAFQSSVEEGFAGITMNLVFKITFLITNMH